MNPQKPSRIDPKLREIYERVMGTPIPTPTTPPLQSTASPLTRGKSVSGQVSQPPQTRAQTHPPVADSTSSPYPTQEPQLQPEIDPQLQYAPTSKSAPPPYSDSSESVYQDSNFAQEIPDTPTTESYPTLEDAILQPEAFVMERRGKPGKKFLFIIIASIFLVIFVLFLANVLDLKLPSLH
jgi:hypothetical protein